jgi:Trypsin
VPSETLAYKLFDLQGCRVNNDGSTGICCLPPKGGFQQQPQQQFPQQSQQFPQSQQQSQISSNVIDSRPSYTSSSPAQQPARPANVPRPPPPQPFVPPRPVITVPQAVNAQPSYPAVQQVNVIPQAVKPAPQPSFPAQTYPRPNAPQPSYPVDPPPQPIGVDNRPSQTQFFQQQSPSSVNQFPVQAIKVPANNFPAPQPPKITQAPPRYEAPSLPVPTSGCGIRTVSQGAPQDGESAPGEFPWQALISSNDGSRLCAGAVISESAVLVSATCISG